MFHERTKRIDVRYHFLHEIIAHGDIVVSKVITQDNPAAMMTKSLTIAKFVHCSNLVGLGCWVLPYGALLWKRSMVLIFVFRYGIRWCFLLMTGIRIKVEIVDL